MSTSTSTQANGQIDTIKLGDINAAIAPLKIDGDGLLQLGFAPHAKEKASKLYLKSDLPKIWDAVANRLTSARKTLAF